MLVILRAVAAFSLTLLISVQAGAQVFINPANGHGYERVLAPAITWTQARAAASARSFAGRRGGLATLTSASEQNFVIANLTPLQDHWLGGAQRPGFSEPASGWSWITGEDFGPFTTWAPLEPDDAGVGGQDHLMGAIANSWDDVADNHPTIVGYIVEYPLFSSTCSVCDLGVPGEGGDGVVDCADLFKFCTAFFNDSLAADLNGDLFVNAADQTIFMNCYLSPPPTCLSPAVPPNDQCAAAAPITGFGRYAVNICRATSGAEGQGPGCFVGSSFMHADAWFCWTAPSTGTARISGRPIAIYAGCACTGQPLSAAIACSDPAQCFTFVPVMGGQQYLIQIGTPSGIAEPTCPTTLRSQLAEFEIVRVENPLLPCPLCDFNADGFVDCSDYFTQLNSFFASDAACAGGVDVSSILNWLNNCAFAPTPPCTTLIATGPANDLAPNAVPISGTGLFSYTNCRATRTTLQGSGVACTSGSAGPIQQDVWYCWTAPRSGTARLTTVGHSPFDSAIAAYAGCTPVPTMLASALACNDDSSGGTQSTVRFPVLSGQTYLLQIGDGPNASFTTPILAAPPSFELGVQSCLCDWNFDGQLDCADVRAFLRSFLAIDADFDNSGATDSADLFAFLNCLLNPGGSCVPFILPTGAVLSDDCNQPRVISPGVHAIDTACATTDGPAHPACPFPGAGKLINNDVWFLFNTPTFGTLRVDACLGAAFDARIALYSGSACPVNPARLLACNDNTALPACAPDRPAVAANLVAGQDVLIRVGARQPGVTGALQLRVGFIPQFICPPVGPPYRARAYQVRGPSDGLAWSWAVQTPQGCIGSGSTGPVSAGLSAPNLVLEFVNSINAVSLNLGCFPDRLRAVISSVDSTRFTVRVGSPDLPQLWVGLPGTLPNCLVNPIVGPSAPPGVGSCRFNPELVETPLSGRDCNTNGTDDRIDILEGVSIDADLDGYPDECCPADYSGGGLGFDDLFAFLNAWFAVDPSADFNNDFDITFQDIFDYLNAWFAGCG